MAYQSALKAAADKEFRSQLTPVGNYATYENVLEIIDCKETLGGLTFKVL